MLTCKKILKSQGLKNAVNTAVQEISHYIFH
jgi:hypothetical protein